MKVESKLEMGIKKNDKGIAFRNIVKIAKDSMVKSTDAKKVTNSSLNQKAKTNQKAVKKVEVETKWKRFKYYQTFKKLESPVQFDDAVVIYERYTHQPYATSTFNNNDKIHIAIQHQDQYLVPSCSLIHVQEKLTKRNGTAVEAISFVNNGILFVFSEIRHEMNADSIDRCKNVGITTTMKGSPSFTPIEFKSIETSWKCRLDYE